MKRALLSLLVLLALSPSLGAQTVSGALSTTDNSNGNTRTEQKLNFRLGAAYLPTIPTFATIFVAIGKSFTLEEGEIANYTMMPWVSAEGLYSINKKVSVGLDLAYFTSDCIVSNKETGAIVERGDYMTLISIMPEFRLNYVNKKAVTLYGSLSAGVLISGLDSGLLFSAQVNPIGIELGKKFFGFAEAGIGFSYFGARAGIGYKF